MPWAVIQSRANLTDAGWPTTPAEVLYDSAAAAKTTILNDTLAIYGFDYTDLPTTLVIKGFGVRILGLKDHAGGSGDLRLGVELSWDSGSTWTTTGYQTALLNFSAVEYILGSPADDWGRTWSRAELVGSNTFRMRITAKADSSSGSPTWHAVYASVSVFYEESSTPTVTPLDNLVITERLLTTLINAEVREDIGIWDSGSTRDAAGGIRDRKTQHIIISGTAVSTLETSADFDTFAVRPQTREGFGIRLQVSTTSAVFYIGDSTLVGGTGYPLEYMQPGLLSIGEIHQEADFVGGNRISSLEVSLGNHLYRDQRGVGAETELRLLSWFFADEPAIGRTITVWAFVESGEGWRQRILFDGLIEELEFKESEIIIRGMQIGTMGKQIPDIVVDENLFDYEPGSAALDTGEEIPGQRGKVVPVGIGRFDIGAVKKTADFAAGHPFRYNNQSGSPTEDEKIYPFSAMLPAMLGVKHPMMPTVHVARKFRRTNEDGTAENKYKSFPYQNLYLFGSRKSSPRLKVNVGFDESSTNTTNIFPYDGIGATSSYVQDLFQNKFHALWYVLLWTWHSSETLSVGLPFVKPLADTWFQTKETGSALAPGRARREVSAGIMEENWSDGTARDCYGTWTNEALPSPIPPNSGTIQGVIKRWPGVLQTVALPVAGPTLIESSVLVWNTLGNSTYTPAFMMRMANEKPDNATDFSNLEDYARIQNNYRFSVQMPLSGPSLGKMRAVRICMMWNNTTSTATNVYILARFGPRWSYVFPPSTTAFPLPGVQLPFAAESCKDLGTTYDEPAIGVGGVTVPVYKLNSISGVPYATVWLVPDWHTPSNEPNIITSSEKEEGRDWPYKPIGDWQFSSWDGTYPSSPDPSTFYQSQFPWDVMLMPQGGFLDLYALWMEVVFDSPLYGKVESEFSTTLRSQFRLRTPIDPTRFVYDRMTQRLDFQEQNKPGEIPSVVYVTGKGAVDEAGTITGTVGRIIENPADIAQALIRHYLGAAVFAARATGSTFGSFSTARTLLGATTYRLTVVFDQARTMQQALQTIAMQSKSLILEQLGTSGAKQWRMFVDTPDPATDDPNRMYDGDGHFFRFDEMIQGSLSVFTTPWEDLSSNIVLRYGFHLPTRTWSGEKFCTPEASNFDSDGPAYIAAMATAKNEYNAENPRIFEAPDIWDPAVAEDLCKWYCDQARLRRVVVEFETFIGGSSIQPGHVITFDDELQERVVFPGEGLFGAWSVHQFNVIQVTVRKDVGQLARVFVRVLQTYSAAA